MQLEEPYLSTVLLRYYEELDPAEISRRQDLSVETVRTRLRRAHSILRRRLARPSSVPGRGRATLLAGLPALAEPLPLGAASPALSTIGTTTLTTGGLIVSTPLTVATSTACIVLALATTYCYREWSALEGRDRDREQEVHALVQESQDLRATLGGLEARVEEGTTTIERLRAELARAREELATAATPAESEVEVVLDEEAHDSPATLTLAEADELGRNLIHRGDLEGLLHLAGDLLKLGPPGHEKILELSRQMEQDDVMRRFQTLFHHEEFIGGPAVTLASRHGTEILEFFTWAESIPLDEFPRILHGVRRGFERGDDLALLVLGLEGVGDEKSLAPYVERYGSRAENPRLSPRDVENAIRALGVIRTEASLDRLLGMLERPLPPRLGLAVVESIVQQRSPDAVPHLRKYREGVGDLKLLTTIDSALRFLE